MASAGTSAVRIIDSDNEVASVTSNRLDVNAYLNAGSVNVGDIDAEALGKRKASELVGLESEIKSRTVLLDWKNVKEEDKEIPYSQEKAYEFLVTFDEFRTWVDEQSDLLAEQREKATKQIKKK